MKADKQLLFDTATAILARYIKDNNMRNTDERIAILRMLYETDELMTPEEIRLKMEPVFMVSRATVYNALNLFSMLGLVMSNIQGKTVKYGSRNNERDNFQTICTRCGKIQRYESFSVSVAFTNAKYNRFHPEQIIANIYGICSYCQAKETRSKRRKE